MALRKMTLCQTPLSRFDQNILTALAPPSVFPADARPFAEAAQNVHCKSHTCTIRELVRLALWQDLSLLPDLYHGRRWNAPSDSLTSQTPKYTIRTQVFVPWLFSDGPLYASRAGSTWGTFGHICHTGRGRSWPFPSAHPDVTLSRDRTARWWREIPRSTWCIETFGNRTFEDELRSLHLVSACSIYCRCYR